MPVVGGIQQGLYTDFSNWNRASRSGLISLDIYGKCREKLYQLRINQINTQYSRLLKRAGLVCDFTSDDPEC